MKEQPQNILFFGRISPYKGIEYLCEAMTIVHEALPKATLTIAGGGKLYFDTTKYDKLPYINITNRYIGMEELASLLTKCTVTVCPYTDATQSGVIMTSYSLCKPVVATNVGGLGEMVDNGRTGLLVPPKNAKALAEAIIEILADDNKCRQMKENIRNDYFINEKSWNCIADKYISIYKDTLQ
jgi:glycosyltransferase involved in cell wall biosynthesis